MRSIGRDPIFVASGEGAEIVDVDGNRYVDFVSSWGPLIAGHAHPRVIEAVGAAAARGTSFGAPTEAEVEIAAETGIEDRRTLYSSTEFKKIRLLYFTDEHRRWEAEHAG